MDNGPRKKVANEEEASGEDEQAPKSTLEAFESARTMWPVSENRETPGPCPGTSDIAPENLAKALAAASASQKRENERESSDRGSKEAKFRPDHTYTAQDVWSWYDKSKLRRMRPVNLQYDRLSSKCYDEWHNVSAANSKRQISVPPLANHCCGADTVALAQANRRYSS